MTAQRPPAPGDAPTGSDTSLPVGLPKGTDLLRIRFTSERLAEHEVVLEFPPSIHLRAVRVREGFEPQKGDRLEALLLLTIPLPVEAATEQEQEALLARVRAWIDAASPGDPLQPRTGMMTLQGVRIFWNRGRFAVLAPPDRLDTVCGALIDASYYEADLRDIERIVGESWPEMEGDVPLASAFDERSIPQRTRLQQRFQQVLLLRARLARLAPHVHCPHLHPPSLASQVGERFRERTRVAHRHEMLSEQVEVFEKVYETSGQRASDFMLTRSGNILEWVIIVLLLTQILLSGFDYLTTMGT